MLQTSTQLPSGLQDGVLLRETNAEIEDAANASKTHARRKAKKYLSPTVLGKNEKNHTHMFEQRRTMFFWRRRRKRTV